MKVSQSISERRFFLVSCRLCPRNVTTSPGRKLFDLCSSVATHGTVLDQSLRQPICAVKPMGAKRGSQPLSRRVELSRRFTRPQLLHSSPTRNLRRPRPTRTATSLQSAKSTSPTRNVRLYGELSKSISCRLCTLILDDATAMSARGLRPITHSLAIPYSLRYVNAIEHTRKAWHGIPSSTCNKRRKSRRQQTSNNYSSVPSVIGIHLLMHNIGIREGYFLFV